MGGAGFPTSMKWDLVRKQPDPVKYIVCNADESEPGTIKDRFIMTNLPHLLIEGMIIAGLVTGAKRGILYIRHEYHLQKEILGEEISRCYRSGLLGKQILGSNFDYDLEVFVSPAATSAVKKARSSKLLRAIAPSRATSLLPGQIGLWQKPTVINNVETFINVPQILARGIDWFVAQGAGGARGLKFVGVSGHVARPGIFEVAMGVPLREVIFNHAGGIRGGRQLKAFAPSGPSSGYLPASMVDVRLDFKALAEAGSMLGSGAIVVCDDGTCMLDMALNAVRFYRNESCGKCVPCRVGSQKMADMLVRWTQGGVLQSQYRADLALLDELSQAMSLTSICGLGQIVPAPIQSVLKHFRSEIDAHVLQSKCPSGSASPWHRALAKLNASAFALSMTTATTPPGMIDITLDGATRSRARRYERVRCRAHERGQHPHSLSPAKPNSGWCLPPLRCGHRRACPRCLLCAPGGTGYESRYEFRQSFGCAQNRPRTSDVRSSFPVRAPAEFRRLRTGDARKSCRRVPAAIRKTHCCPR